METKEVAFLVEEDLEGGYNARAFGHSLFTEGEALEEVKSNIKDALRCHFDKEEMPTVIQSHIVKEELFYKEANE